MKVSVLKILLIFLWSVQALAFIDPATKKNRKDFFFLTRAEGRLKNLIKKEKDEAKRAKQEKLLRNVQGRIQQFQTDPEKHKDVRDMIAKRVRTLEQRPSMVAKICQEYMFDLWSKIEDASHQLRKLQASSLKILGKNEHNLMNLVYAHGMDLLRHSGEYSKNVSSDGLASSEEHEKKIKEILDGISGDWNYYFRMIDDGTLSIEFEKKEGGNGTEFSVVLSEVDDYFKATFYKDTIKDNQKVKSLSGLIDDSGLVSFRKSGMEHSDYRLVQKNNTKTKELAEGIAHLEREVLMCEADSELSYFINNVSRNEHYARMLIGDEYYGEDVRDIK